MSEPTNFEEFWPYYVSQHSNRICRQCHLAGFVLAFLLGLWGLIFFPLVILVAPALGYTLAWVGHLVFEKNRPASWYSGKYFAWSFLGDLRMTLRTFQGRMEAELEAAAALYPESE